MIVAWWSLLAAGGEIAGTVVGADGSPVVDAFVVAYDHRLNYAYALTQDDGSFRLVDLPARPWRLRFVPADGDDRVEQWHAGTLDYCDAEPVELSGDDAVLTVDATLPIGGSIEGVLVDAGGDPVAGAELVMVSATEDSIAYPRGAVSEADGRFALRGIPLEAGDVGAVAIDVAAEGWPDQYLGGAYDAEDADVYEVGAGEVLELGEVALLDGISVGGAVNGPDGPVAFGTVYAYSPSQVVDTTITDGRYVADGLPPGEALSWAVADGYAITYYPDADRPGDRVQVDEGEFYDALDLTLAEESVLRGQIAGSVDFSQATVLAYNDTRTVGIGAAVESDGSFEVHGLHGGDYTLYVYAADEGYVSDFVREPDGTETVFSVPDAAESEVYDIVLPEGARLKGKVTDLYTGEPVYGAWVYAQGATTGEAAVGETDDDGRYRIDGLPADTWELWVDYEAYCPNDPGYVGVAYPDRIGTEPALLVAIAGGEVFEWDPALPPDDDHDGMDDVWEEEHGLDPDRDDADEDPDGDGYSNLQEYWVGTDPLDAAPEARSCGCGRGADAWLLAPLFLAGARRRRAAPR